MAKTVTVNAKGWKLTITPGVGVFKVEKAEYSEDTGHLVVWVIEGNGEEGSHCFSLELPDGEGAGTLAVDIAEQWKFELEREITLSPIR